MVNFAAPLAGVFGRAGEAGVPPEPPQDASETESNTGTANPRKIFNAHPHKRTATAPVFSRARRPPACLAKQGKASHNRTHVRMKRVWNWIEIQQYHDEGHGFVECQRHFGFSHTAWVKAISRGELRSHGREFANKRRRYDWAAVQAYYDEGHSFRECRAKFGFCAATWDEAKKRGEVVPRRFAMPIDELLNGPRCRTHVKLRLLRAGLLENKCEKCGLESWLGGPLSMHIDHINGVRDDHRLENLRMLCPNCHSQTETYSGRNRKRRKRLQETRPAV